MLVNLHSLILLAVTSFTVALALTPVCRGAAVRWGLVDRPDEVRKFHVGAIPRVGGIAIFVGYVASFAVLVALPLGAGSAVRGQLDIVWKLFPAAAIVFFTGLVDDLVGLKPWQKFAGQLMGAAVAVWAGVEIHGIAGRGLPGWSAVPVTLVWLVGCTNAFNLIDGVDGLAAGVGLFATATVLIAAVVDRNVGLAIATVPLAGALLGILRFNFNPASIFLGDSGSLFIGFLLGCYSVLWVEKSATILGMTAPLMALSIPLVDTGLAIARRFLRREPILRADHGHIHHQLLGRGLTPRRVVVVLYVVCGVCAALSLLESFAHERYEGVIIVLFCGGVWMAVQHLGYAEFEMARRMVLGGNFRRQLNAELRLCAFRGELAAARGAEECWAVLQRSYSDFGFNEIRFKAAERIFTHTTNGHHVANTWTVRINFSENNYLNLSREYDTAAPPIVARFTDAIGEILCPKAAEMLRGAPARRDVAIAGVHLQPGAAGGIKKPLQPMTELQ